ncbi:MAG: hypothetical protein AB7O49_09080 [Sphingomonadales bacterium]
MESIFETAWRRHYPNHEPVGYRMLTNDMLMAADDAQCWARFHSLPESKRYADTPVERAILLERSNTLANEVLGDGSACWLVQTQWVTPDRVTDIADEFDPFRACHEYGLSFAFRFLVDEGDDDVRPWNVYAAPVRWCESAFDDLLWAIANERAGPTLWMSQATGAVFAPYDGGVDLFLPSTKMVVALKNRYAAWLSNHPLGL